MSKRTFLDIVRGSASKKVSENCPSSQPFAGLVNWLAEHQVEEEHAASAKAINASVVSKCHPNVWGFVKVVYNITDVIIFARLFKEQQKA